MTTVTKGKTYSLKTQLTRQFVVFAIILSLIFSSLNFLTLYVIEDGYFALRLDEEANRLQQHYHHTQTWSAPLYSYMSLHETRENFPQDIREKALTHQQQSEFFGENERFYHVHALHETGPFLVAEVSKMLLVRAKTQNILWLLCSLTVIMLLLATVLGITLGKHILSPLTRLANTVESMSPDNLQTHFKHEYPNNEIGKLASTLEKSMQRIQHFITREQHFTRDISHELRTPTAIINSSAALLTQDKTLLSNEQHTHISRIQNACQNMQQTISALLSLAREENAPSLQEVNVLASVERVVVDQAHLLTHKDVEVDIQISNQATLMLSITHLEILLTNLIKNAFQYTIEGCVTIHFAKHTLSVRDTGVGIEDTIKEQACHSLVKGQHSQGFGIGLSLVSRLCEHYDIHLNIQHLQPGTHISLVFPTHSSNV